MSRKNISYVKGYEHSDFTDLLNELQEKNENNEKNMQNLLHNFNVLF